jgi:AcrR family transcriptional regulator
MTQTAQPGTTDREDQGPTTATAPTTSPAPTETDDDALPPKFAQAIKAKRRAQAHETNSTRERILDVALDLFLAQGYDGTSLRQIAEQLGVTKAALYYHFQSKEDILLALHMRIHDFGKEALDSLDDEPMTIERWGQLLDQVVDQMLAQRKLFLMHQRNQAAMEKLHSEAHEAANDDIQNRFRKILLDDRVPERDRVRMAAAFGAAFAGLFLAGDSFSDSDTSKLGDMLRDCIRDIIFG